MKTWHQSILAAWAWAALAGGIHAETSSFTHSGMLQNNDSPANGLFDLEVTLHSSEFDNTPVGDPSTVSIPSLPITDGLFLITLTLRPPDGWAYFHLDNGPSGGRPVGRLRISHGVNPGDFEIMTITQESNVGIGMSNPTHTLSVSNAANEETVRLIGPDNSSAGPASGLKEKARSSKARPATSSPASTGRTEVPPGSRKPFVAIGR